MHCHRNALNRAARSAFRFASARLLKRSCISLKPSASQAPTMSKSVVSLVMLLIVLPLVSA
jgi:hypothetical protein